VKRRGLGFGSNLLPAKANQLIYSRHKTPFLYEKPEFFDFLLNNIKKRKKGQVVKKIFFHFSFKPDLAPS
jgi:hypothetical protein